MSPKLIILVEDDINLRQSSTLILQRANYLVTATDCVFKAMQNIQSRKYQLAILDIDVPKMEEVLLPRILDDYPSMAMVILTDRSEWEANKDSRLLSAYYMMKPIAPELLLDRVRRIIGVQAGPNQNIRMRVL